MYNIYIHSHIYIYNKNNKKETLKTVQIILKSNVVLCSAYIRTFVPSYRPICLKCVVFVVAWHDGPVVFSFFVVVVAFVVSRSSLLTYAPLIRLWGIMRMTVLLLLLPQSAVWIYKKCSQLRKQLLKS